MTKPAYYEAQHTQQSGQHSQLTYRTRLSSQRFDELALCCDAGAHSGLGFLLGTVLKKTIPCNGSYAHRHSRQEQPHGGGGGEGGGGEVGGGRVAAARAVAARAVAARSRVAARAGAARAREAARAAAAGVSAASEDRRLYRT